MLQTGELAADVGSVIYGEEAVELGLIDRIGGLSDALSCLHEMIEERKSRGRPFPVGDPSKLVRPGGYFRFLHKGGGPLPPPSYRGELSRRMQ